MDNAVEYYVFKESYQ